MKEVNELIGLNLKKLREERGYSIGKLSEIVQVSKSMLSQIEKGETNPSVGTIWKIANGLRVSFTSLLNEDIETFKTIKKEDIQIIRQDDEGYALYPYFPYNADKKFEMYSVELESSSEHYSEAHVKGVEEYFLVTEGKIKVTIGMETIILEAGDAVNFTAEKEHRYENLGDQMAKGVILLYYNE
ncbi:helix-turn-helix domain-containing protein [Acidaminobacter sp. JC074]|uniref:helix-turn-helix domain-containing protein n=1 Tax=Acidaminobacter sp. JC074 TaxID=2530199 RepID=UPI001F0F0577|nr:XRE family transcriptional regulator [Acidaminobacter sp. JC074]MCH4890377.1 helix-turn-helix domain-containing protein [Acidaminobacter sp. JC074]